MIGMVKEMKKRKNGIPENVITIFENILNKHRDEQGRLNLTGVKEDEFYEAMNKYLTKEQRFRLYETQGACNGVGADKERKAFAIEYAHLALDDRMALFAETFGRWKPVLNNDNTLTLTFKCGHGYYLQAKQGKYITPPPNVEAYFERCAGGRLYELQKALGIKLKIKSVDVSPLNKNVSNPVIFTFELME